MHGSKVRALSFFLPALTTRILSISPLAMAVLPLYAEEANKTLRLLMDVQYLKQFTKSVMHWAFCMNTIGPIGTTTLR